MKEAALNFVKRGMICLEDEDFDKADSFFEKALDEDAECSDAYFGLLLSDKCCKNEKEFAELGLPVEDDRNFALAKRFATEEQTEAYNRISKEIVEAARKKAVVCGDNKEYSLALAWLTRIGEEQTQYGKFYQMGVMTDGFTTLNISTVNKYSKQADLFLREVTSEELKEKFKATNEAYLAFIQKAAEEAEKERIRREKEAAERKIQKEAEEKRKAEEAVLKAEENKRREAEKKKRKEEAEKQRLERLALEKKRRIRKNVITVVILLALAGFIAIFATIIYPNILYNSAVDAINEQRYSSAIHDLTDLGHKDSEELLKKANYLYAEQFFENEDYENARTYYQAAGNYLDAEEKAVESHQRKLYSEGNYKELVTLYGVTEIRVPDGVHTIAGYAMAGLNQVTDIYLPKSVVKLDWGSLQGCSSLVAIHYEGTMQEWAMISKNWYWDADTGAYTVYCSDGEISKAS